MPDSRSIPDLHAMAVRMRRNILAMTLATGTNGAHVGPALSLVEICAVLYGAVMRFDSQDPLAAERDRFLLSKGHGALALYAALAEAGFLTADDLRTFEAPESLLSGQPTMCVEKGIEISSGSLGLGLSIGIGVALAGRKAGRRYRTFVLMGDGECNEGTVWEAAMAAAHFKLGRLIAIIDANGLQSDGACDSIMNMGSQEAKWSSFGWEVRTVEGHNLAALVDSLVAPRGDSDRPLVIVATTVKGKGVSFMENNNEWHNNRLTQAQYDQALRELSASEELFAGRS